MQNNESLLRAEVVYALKDIAHRVEVEVPAGSSIEFAIRESGILGSCTEIDLQHNRVGVFGELRELSESVNSGDRIEIYRPLLADPKDARRRRARQGRNEKRKAGSKQ